MDLVTIIGELKLELECLKNAISSLEALVRLQGPAASPSDPKEDASQSGAIVPPVKRGRGRPRKDPAPDTAAPTGELPPDGPQNTRS
jgi:hypothetical protein